MIRRPPRSTLDRSSAASDVYKRQGIHDVLAKSKGSSNPHNVVKATIDALLQMRDPATVAPVSYTHLRAHETVLDLVCRLLLEKKKNTTTPPPPLPPPHKTTYPTSEQNNAVSI